MMTNKPNQTSRYESIKADLLAAAPKPPADLSSKLGVLSAARLSNLMLTDNLKSVGEDGREHLGELLEDINKATDAMPDANVFAKRAVFEVMAINNIIPVGQSNRNSTSIKALLDKTDANKSAGVVALSRQQTMFDTGVTRDMPDVVDFIKGNEAALTDSQLAQVMLVANNRLDQDKRLSDSALNAGSFVNLLNHKGFESVFHRISDNPNLALLMFENLGEPFALSLYHHSIDNSSDSHAMSLLSHSKHGLLKDAKTNVVNDPQIKSLMQFLVKGENATSNIDRLLSTAKTPHSMDAMLDALTDVHNDHYSAQNLANVLDKVGAGLSTDQLKRFGEALVKSYQQQPVLPALKKLLDISKDKGVRFSHIERASAHIRDELEQDFKALTSPASRYSTTAIEFDGSVDTVFLKDAKSIPHLQIMIDKGLASTDGYQIHSGDTLLDQKTKDALIDYLDTGNPQSLNSLMTQPIRASEKDSSKWGQLLFEANKQNRNMPTNTTDDIKVMSDIVNTRAGVFADGERLADLRDIRSSNDLMNKLGSVNIRSLDIDETGLGKDYDKRLLSSIKELAEEPTSFEKQCELNDLVGLPVTELSSKIEKPQENNTKSGNIIKNAIDSLGAATSSLRQPK